MFMKKVMIAMMIIVAFKDLPLELQESLILILVLLKMGLSILGVSGTIFLSVSKRVALSLWSNNVMDVAKIKMKAL